jgi:Domain of unknown function (DUF4145)
VEEPTPAPTDLSCGHCGFAGPIKHKGDVIVHQEVEGDFHRGGIVWSTIVSVYVCPKCEEPTVWQYIWTRDLFEQHGDRRLYATLRDNSPVPSRVRARLDEALRIKTISPSYYAVSIRRMLETVCNEEGASGRDLFQKLDDLVSKQRIPAQLADVAHQLRELGNLGAHDADVEISPEDVPVIEDLADAILEYLYRAPTKLASVQQALSQRTARAPKRAP